jgi:small subunit ribosomal protein S13
MAEKFRSIIRIAGTDIPGDMPVKRGIRKIKGISFMTANAICTKFNLKNKKIGELSDKDIDTLIAYLQKIPKWMKNRHDKHILSADIDMTTRTDINFLKRIRAYRGIRHERNLPVRGQRTRSSFRKGSTVGVKRKTSVQAKR